MNEDIEKIANQTTGQAHHYVIGTSSQIQRNLTKKSTKNKLSIAMQHLTVSYTCRSCNWRCEVGKISENSVSRAKQK